MIRLSHLDPKFLAREPYQWAFFDGLIEPHDAAALTASFPHDNFKVVTGYDGEKRYAYEVRSLVGMGATMVAHAELLSPAWRRLAQGLLSPAYRAAISRLVDRDLASLPMEINLFHYGPGSFLGPHLDVENRLITHIFYFNSEWKPEDGGYLSILRSSDIGSHVFQIAPLAGHSVVLVRSAKSWHAISAMISRDGNSRRSMTVSFHSRAAVSTLWPPGDETPLHDYDGTNQQELIAGMPGPATRWRRRMAHLIKTTAKEKAPYLKIR